MRNSRIAVFTAIVLCAILKLNAQALTNATDLTDNKNYFNPAMFYNEQRSFIGMRYKSQLNSYNNNFDLFGYHDLSENFHMAFNSSSYNIENEFKESSMNLDLGYKFQTYNAENTISLGLKFGFNNINPLVEQTYYLDWLDTMATNHQAYNLGLGIVFATKRMSFGFSVPGIFKQSHIIYSNGKYVLMNKKIHVNGFFEKRFSFTKQRNLKFNAFLSNSRDSEYSKFESTSYLSLTYDKGNNYSIGAYFHVSSGVGMVLSKQLTNNLKIMYSTDYTYLNVGEKSNFNHELTIILNLFNNNPIVHRSPRRH